MVGESNGVHPGCLTFIHYLFYLGQTVQERVMAVYM